MSHDSIGSSHRRLRSGVLAAVIVLVGALAAALSAAGPAKPVSARTAPTPVRAQGAPAPSPADYAGEATCMGCHDDRDYKGQLHGLASNPRTPRATHGCESCHGPGKAHAESGDAKLILHPSKVSPQRASEQCTTCHTRNTHVLWAGSQHDQRNVGCVSCHSVHAPKGPHQLKAKDQMALCSTCHKAVTNKQHRLNHMPVREGAMTCTSCHNVHGSTNVKLLKAGTTIDESCTSCHADKRGPYLWEHAPVSESCVTCHDPHGSNNERMLVSKVPFLCQRCHVTSRHPPTVYEGTLLRDSTNGNKLRGRGCVICHQQIHGSNAPSGKALLR